MDSMKDSYHTHYDHHSKPSSHALPTQETCLLSSPPTPRPYHPSPRVLPRKPLCCTVSTKLAPLKFFLELAWTHMGPRWLKIARHGLGTNLEKMIFDHFWAHR